MALETHGEPIELDTAVSNACAADPEVFRTPHAPLGELLPTLGFAVRQEWLAEEGFDFAGRQAELRGNNIAQRHRLESHEAQAVLSFVDGYRHLAYGRTAHRPEIPREHLGLLAEPTVAAEALGPNWPAALEDLARYAGDRGDATRVIVLLPRAGTETDDELLE